MSDSEDDCYGNIAQKLQSIKNSIYKKGKVEAEKNVEESVTISSPSKNREKPVKNDDSVAEIVSDVSFNTTETEEITLDEIIAQNSKKCAARKSKRLSDIAIDNILPEHASRRKRTKRGGKTSNSADISVNNVETTLDTLNTSNVSTSNLDESNASTSSRGRSRGRRSRGRQSNTRVLSSRDRHAQHTAIRSWRGGRLSNISNTPRRARRSNNTQYWASSRQSNIPYYSVGNTDEYPDQCDEQELFQSKPQTVETVLVEENDLDDNEELSVKVYWQNSEYIKFNIRKYQKISQIFEFFAQKENVSQDKLFFTYNDKILQVNDTPDTIGYSIAKFIDGGVVHQSVSNLIQKETNEVQGGITIKFQCQNVKTPFKIKVRLDDKLSVAMLKCAEHLEKPLDKLKFYFDGDLISGRLTPEELELEGEPVITED